jgi:hypothetical protein
VEFCCRAWQVDLLTWLVHTDTYEHKWNSVQFVQKPQNTFGVERFRKFSKQSLEQIYGTTTPYHNSAFSIMQGTAKESHSISLVLKLNSIWSRVIYIYHINNLPKDRSTNYTLLRGRHKTVTMVTYRYVTWARNSAVVISAFQVSTMLSKRDAS